MREVTVDASRFLCFSAVVFLHFFSYSRADPLQISSIVDNLTRFAVPVFFMITGYLLYSSGRKSDELIKIYFVRLFVIFVFWEVVYYAIDAWIVAIRPSTYEVRSAFDEILWIFYTGGIAFHLWFVPWLFVSVAIFVLLKSAVPRIWLYLIGVVSFAIGLALGPYNMESNLSGLVAQFGANPALYTARNTPFFGVGFLCFGYWFAEHRSKMQFSTTTVVLIAAIGLGIQLLETVYLVDSSPIGIWRPATYDVRFGTIIFSTAIFVLLMTRFDNMTARSLSDLGVLALGMYCVHGIFILALNRYAFHNLSFDGWIALSIRALSSVAVICAAIFLISLLYRISALRRFLA